jgi:uncharacterized membrane protein YjjP (DUF1212 family)
VTDPTPPRWRTALWRGETAPIPVVRTPTRAVYPRRRPGEDTELAAVDHGVTLTLRVGTLLLSGGAPTEDVEAAMFAVGTAVGLDNFEVDITYGSIIISVPPTGERPGITDARVVRGRSTHYAKVAAAHRLVLDLSEGRLAPQDVESRLDAIEHLRRPYPRWFVVMAFGALSAAITVQLGGNARTAVLAFLTASATGFVGNRMAQRKVPVFFINMTVAFASVAIVVGITALEPDDGTWRIRTSLVIVGGIIALLPGMSLMVAAQEAIGSFAVTAAGRIVELTFATIGIVSGVLLGLTLADNRGITLSPTVNLKASASVVVIAVLAAAVAAAAAALTYQSPWRLAVVGGLVAGLGILIFAGMEQVVAPNSEDLIARSPGAAAAATAVPAIAIGFASRWFGVRLKVPPVLVTVPGIVPLLPGLAVYQGLLSLSENDPQTGLQSLVRAIAIAIALAAGVLLGQLLAGRLMHGGLPQVIPPRDITRRAR